MKIRTDFVTNSSSSSFVVDLKIELEDGTSLCFSRYETSGDADTNGRSYVARNASKEIIANVTCDPYEYCRNNLDIYDPDAVPWEITDVFSSGAESVDLNKISNASNVAELIKVLTSPFNFDNTINPDLVCDFEYDDEECYDDEEEDYEDFDDFDEYGELSNEEIATALRTLVGYHNEITNSSNSILKEHLQKTSDLKSVKLVAEFSGRGDCLSDAEDIVGYLIKDYKQKREVVDVLNNDDKDEIINNLRGLTYLKNYTTTTLVNLVEFYKSFSDTYDVCRIVQTLTPDGINVTFEIEEY